MNPFRNLTGRAARALLPEGWPRTLRQEAGHVVRAYRLLRGARLLVVSGGGQLDEVWGGPWGHPFTLFKWALLARLRRVPVLFLSVGFGVLDSAAGRRLTRWALALARYRSYRDEGSKNLMARAAGFVAGDAVRADLAYGLRTDGRADVRASEGTRRRVGVSPISYRDPRVWPTKSAAMYEGYITRLASATRSLVDEGHEVVVFTSDLPDVRAAHDLLDEVGELPAGSTGSLRLEDSGSVASFIEIAARMNVVIASRLHGLILTHMAGTPAVALSYDRKVDVLMETMEHSTLCLGIDDFLAADVVGAVERCLHEAPAMRRHLRETVLALRANVDEQYDAVLGAFARDGGRP